MLSTKARDFILHITNYFNGHWEDPDWGTMPINQVLIGVTISQLAEGIQDAAVRRQIQTIAKKSIAENSQLVAKG